MTDIKTSGSGVVIPPGLIKKKLSLEIPEDKKLAVKLLDFERNEDGEIIDDTPTMQVEYPDGSVRGHQFTGDIGNFLDKISRQLMNKFGVKTFQFESVPEEVVAGAVINLKEVE